ncbi:MAG: beta-ketoacyl-[acyl-carrier-protein] synthase family protein [Gammaproteobacteria bacterium]|nr:beta-ketoacyl-[acyl-carrier-protein] synthase family protein [Gammaproteobacteria bacterium]
MKLAEMSRRRDVVVTGIGVISPIGVNADEVVASLVGGRSGIRLCQVHALTKVHAAGIVPAMFDDQFSKLELPYLDRCQQMAIVGARQAISDAGLENFADDGQRAGVFYGNVRGGATAEQGWYEQLFVDHKQMSRPFTAMALMHNAGAAHISIRHQILGPVMTHASACAASTMAIGEALRAIRDGYLDVAVAGGAEAPLTAFNLGMFEGTRALAMPDPVNVGRSCKPFAKNRTGLVLGEGAAFVVLESLERAIARGASIYAVLSGYGVASDGYHIGAPKADGQTAAIQAALADAGLQPADIHYLNAHGTATRGGDEVEARAIRLAFGAAADTLPVSSTKSVHGHLIGAAGALELVITILALTKSFLPATANLDQIDPACALNHIANVPIIDHSIDHAMSFSCGFGGTNAALVISKPRDLPSRCAAGSFTTS